MIETCFLVSDRNWWALRVAAHQFLKHGGQDRPVTVVGFSPPDFDLPPLWNFISVGPQDQFPVDHWSDAVIAWLTGPDRPSDLFVMMLEDYWLMRQASWQVVDLLAGWAERRKRLLRLDLTLDRANERGAVDVAYLGFLDIIRAPTTAPYKVSLQAAIWRRDVLLEILRPGESPWMFEGRASAEIANDDRFEVLGTRQAPVRYVIGIRQGRPSVRGYWQYPSVSLTQADIDQLLRMELIEPQMTEPA